jgi:hypothetical protein
MPYKNIFPSRPFAAIMLLLAALILSLLSCEKDNPPAKHCRGTFYALKASPGVEMVFNLHEFAKPLPEPFVSVSVAGPFSLPTELFNIRSNFSAYDSTDRRYVYLHHFGFGAEFFSMEVESGTPTRTLEGRIDMCPVFHGKPTLRRLYSIFIEQLSATNWLYNIVDIDPVTGQANFVIGGDDVTTNSPMSAEAMSAVSTDGDLFYFLSGTNLIEANPVANTFRYIDIDPTFNSIDNFVQYFGLEYKRDEDLLLAMKNSTNFTTGALTTSLVSIRVTTGAPVLTTLFDISAALPAGTDRFVNPEFYSSTFDPCDNTYYATTMQGMEVINTRVIEINLPKNEMKQRVLDGYWYGMEFVGR